MQQNKNQVLIQSQLLKQYIQDIQKQKELKQQGTLHQKKQSMTKFAAKNLQTINIHSPVKQLENKSLNKNSQQQLKPIFKSHIKNNQSMTTLFFTEQKIIANTSNDKYKDNKSTPKKKLLNKTQNFNSISNLYNQNTQNKITTQKNFVQAQKKSAIEQLKQSQNKMNEKNNKIGSSRKALQNQNNEQMSQIRQKANKRFLSPQASVKKVIPECKPKKKEQYYMKQLEEAFLECSKDDYECLLFREHFQQNIQSLYYCKNFKKASEDEIKKIEFKIGGKKKGKEGKKTLIFDLDETLVHCKEELDLGCDVILDIEVGEGEELQASVNIRPHAKEVLERLSREFEVGIFTASKASYARAVVGHLDPKGEYVDFMLFREHCVVREGNIHVKDLRVIQDRRLEELILVDNAAYSFMSQLSCGVPILPFYDSKDDQQLLYLQSYLEHLLTHPVQTTNIKHFKMHLYSNSLNLDTVHQLLFKS